MEKTLKKDVNPVLSSKKTLKNVIVFGTFDFFDKKVCDLFRFCREVAVSNGGGKLLIGVKNDFLSLSENYHPFMNMYSRADVAKAFGDDIFLYDTTNREIIKKIIIQNLCSSIVLTSETLWMREFLEKYKEDIEKTLMMKWNNQNNKENQINVCTLKIIEWIDGISYCDEEKEKQEGGFEEAEKMYPLHQHSSLACSFWKKNNLCAQNKLVSHLLQTMFPDNSLLFDKEGDVQKELSTLPNKGIFNDKKCLMISRGQHYHAAHLIPYTIFFKDENVFWWFSENEILNDFSVIEKAIGKKIDRKNVLVGDIHLQRTFFDVCFISEIWKPSCSLIKQSFPRSVIYFVDHGICVGTRPPRWFANYWQDSCDKLLVAGLMQTEQHVILNNNEPHCHTKFTDDENIITIGWPRSCLSTEKISWIWNLYEEDKEEKEGKEEKNKKEKEEQQQQKKYRILLCPTEYNTSYLHDPSFVEYLVMLCRTNQFKIILKPHPRTPLTNCTENPLRNLFNALLKEDTRDNFLMIPSSLGLYTPHLFETCDLAFFDKSSLGYEYLLFNKPAVVICESVNKDWEMPKTMFLNDGFPCFEKLSDCTLDTLHQLLTRENTFEWDTDATTGKRLFPHQIKEKSPSSIVRVKASEQRKKLKRYVFSKNNKEEEKEENLKISWISKCYNEFSNSGQQEKD